MSVKTKSRLYIWFLAARPKTLSASVVPVVLGGAHAVADGSFNLSVFLLILITAVLIQVGTNFANDVLDFEKGADSAERLGPLRVTQAGLISPAAMKRATALVLLSALVLGVVLVFIGGLPILLIGLASLFFAVGYTSGPFPLAYLGLGEIFVIAFFGPVAVGGTFYLLTDSLNALTITSGIGVGCLSAAILVVNNLRDYAQDKIANKKTLVVRFGTNFARYEYTIFLLIAAAVPVAEWLLGLSGGKTLLSLVSFVFALRPLMIVRAADGAELNPALPQTSKLLLAYGLLYTVGVLQLPY